MDVEDKKTESLEYGFEYTDSFYFNKLVGLNFALCILLIFSIGITKAYIGVPWGIIIAFAVPILIFYLNRKKIKKQGTALIGENFVDFSLHKSTDRVEFKNIKKYLIIHNNGVYLRIQLNNEIKITIAANENFCKPDKFELFCDDFEVAIEKSRNENQLPPIRKKSFFERKWFVTFLIIVSAFAVVSIIVGLYMGRNFGNVFVKLLPSIGVLGAMWTGYFTARNKEKKRFE